MAQHVIREVLKQELSILAPFLNDSNNTEIVVNKPGQVITETRQGWNIHDVPELTLSRCESIAKVVAGNSRQSLDERSPILSATLPDGQRIQIVRPPAVMDGYFSMTMRKPSTVNFTMESYEEQGFFDAVADHSTSIDDVEKELLSLRESRDFKKFFRLAVESRKNIIVSGATGAGKTAFMRALVDMVPQDERLISIENVDELTLYKSHPNAVPLFYSAGKQGIADITQQQLLETSLRMKPDRIFVAELIRGDEAFYYLRNVNSGHPGSITSMHANSAALAIEQLVLFLKESSSGSTLSREDIKQLIFLCVDIIVQIKNVRGKRMMTEIYYDPEFKRKQMA